MTVRRNFLLDPAVMRAVYSGFRTRSKEFLLLKKCDAITIHLSTWV